MGSLDKMVFKGFVDTGCARKLLLDLGRDDPRWIAPLTPLAPRRFEHDHDEILDLGHDYEASVYMALCVRGGVRFAQSPRGEVVPRALTPALLAGYLDEILARTERLCLLEHQFAVPEVFLRFVLGLAQPEAIPLLESSQGLRPDLLILERSAPADARELLPDGQTCAILPGDRRVALRIVDIKHTAEMRVGKSHFIEILYYSHALAAFLEEAGLRERVYVATSGNGILPQHDTKDLFKLQVGNIDEYIVAMKWADTSHLFALVQRQIAELYRSAPLPIERVAVNVAASCGHCRFVEDCKRRLGFREGVAPADFDVRLLPHTTDALCQQLEAEGFRTVGDVAERMADWQHSDTPEPLYAEKPLLALKAHALVAGRPLEATAERTGGNRHLSMAIPGTSEIELVLDAEADPTNDVVFAVGFSLSCLVDTSAPFYEVHKRWWEAWEQQLRLHRRASEVDLSVIAATLDPTFVARVFPGDKRRDLEQQIRAFAQALWVLRAGAGVELVVGRMGAEIGFGYRFGYINGGAELADERTLAEVLVERGHNAVIVASVLEGLLCVLQTDARGEKFPVGPQFAGFYWSAEQLQHLQDLLERHLEALVHREGSRGPLLQLLRWLSPTDSEVASSLQHKKIFNLRTFVETSIGLPHIINYTWHGLAREAFGLDIDARFWAPHFNYMDFAMWHGLVRERDTSARAVRHQEIVAQLLLKIRSVHRLLRRYRTLARKTLSASSRPVSSADLVRAAPPDLLHPIARVWYLFSALGGAISALGADQRRLTFPAQTIGKLAGGEVSALTVHAPGQFSFELRGLSSNMKLRERARLWLLPEAARDQSGAALDKHLVEVTEMRWVAEHSAYLVSVRAQREGVHPLDTGRSAAGGETWYVYPSESDIWSRRLYGASGCLFSREQMGDSWLGRRLAYLWGIGNDEGIERPPSRTFGLPEIYLYAPKLLPSIPFDPQAMLMTTAHPPPDPSQRHAIHLALASPVSCLQGPPGTGKSQTIAALVDELLHRRGGRPTKILVMAFSYAALDVVLEKVRASRDASGQPTLASRTEAVFLRSASRPAAPTVSRGLARDLVLSGTQMTLDGVRLSRRQGKRLEDALQPTVLMFGNAHQLYTLGMPSASKGNTYELIRDDFHFDLILVDEASQLPTDHFLAAAALVRRPSVPLALHPEPMWPARSKEDLEGLRCATPLDADELTRVVIVGDDRQLPPVQPVKPPRKLRVVLDSLFRYYAEGHKVPRYQLEVNYRSDPPIVAYTRQLGLYKDLRAFREEHPHPPLPAVPAAIDRAWLRRVLAPEVAVSAIVHDRRFETVVSPLEAQIVARIAVAFLEQMGVETPEAEHHLWQEHLGIVSPHNAHGRLVARRIFEALTVGSRRTRLTDEELMACLDSTIYSVEKFQGSDRTFILATFGVSSRDQLRAEEEFIYDLNRFNVLTSRARQKMTLVCSENLLAYVPADREILGNAARIRSFAMEFCDREERFTVKDASGHDSALRLRWHGDAPESRPPEVAARPETPSVPPARDIYDLPEVVLLDTLASAIQSLLDAPSPSVRRDEVIRIVCQRLRLSPLDDETLTVLGALLDGLWAPESA